MANKILIARTDKIGDLILTLPLETAWKEMFPLDEVEWLIEKNTGFVMDHSASRIKYWTLEKSYSFFALLKILKEKKYDISICIQVPWWVAAAIYFSKVPVRLGVASKWFSWIFYNKKVRQKRSQGLKSEGEYNLDLLRNLYSEKNLVFKPAVLQAKEERVRFWKNKLGENFTVIHSGMAGSARNWSVKNYSELIQKLGALGKKVVLTGMGSDSKIISELFLEKTSGVVNLLNQTPPADLLAVLSLAKVIVAPSTGVAHLAASLGKKVIGIYSPVVVQAPKRWAPQGSNVKVLVANVACPGILKCLGEKCSFYDCMDQITVDSVLNNMMEKNI